MVLWAQAIFISITSHLETLICLWLYGNYYFFVAIVQSWKFKTVALCKKAYHVPLEIHLTHTHVHCTLCINNLKQNVVCIHTKYEWFLLVFKNSNAVLPFYLVINRRALDGCVNGLLLPTQFLYIVRRYNFFLNICFACVLDWCGSYLLAYRPVKRSQTKKKTNPTHTTYATLHKGAVYSSCAYVLTWCFTSFRDYVFVWRMLSRFLKWNTLSQLPKCFRWDRSIRINSAWEVLDLKLFFFFFNFSDLFIVIVSLYKSDVCSWKCTYIVNTRITVFRDKKGFQQIIIRHFLFTTRKREAALDAN